MSDADITAQITALEDEQRALREKDTGHPQPAADSERLQQISTELDRLWDELRRRRAKEEFGQDPGTVTERPASQVEGYHD